jgi:hypothetical protein
MNQPGDIYEQEADRTADAIVGMPSGGPVQWSHSASGLRRKCEQCEEQERHHLQRKCAHCEKEERQLQRKESGAGLAAAPPVVHEVLRSPGQALDASARSFMEPRFGHDFARVRVHTDAKAASSARAVNASAYTVGNDIVFDSGRFNSTSRDGRHLLAHELTHVVQQSGMRSPGVLARQPADDQKQKPADEQKPPKAEEEQKPKQTAPKAAKCDIGCSQRWGQDTTCSKWGFKDGTHEVGEGKKKKTADCCNSWPFAVEKHARETLKINGAASCTVRHEREIATVSMGSNSVQVLCSDTIPNDMFGGTSNAKDCDGQITTEVIELSPKAMEDLSGQTTNALHVTVCYSGTKEDLCLHNGPGKAKKPEQSHCLTRGCDAPADTPKLKDTGWPPK